jgi:hypothetical protein
MMLHFLRRTRQQLLEEKKISRFLLYAIGEIILVVIGILLALQISSWNEDRITRKEEQVLLSGLKQEMNDNLAQIQNVILFNKRSRDAARKLLDIYGGNYRDFESTEIDSLFAQVQWAWTFNPKVGVLNSIKTTGRIGTIRNPEIQSFITSFEEAANDAGEESLLIRAIIVDTYVKSVSKYISLRSRVKYIGYDVDPGTFPSDYPGIFKDRELESLLTYIYIWRDNEMDELNELVNILSRNISIVEKDIRTRPQTPK